MLFARTKRASTGSAAELPVTILILFAVFAFPIINLTSLALAYGTVWYISFQSALIASTQSDFDTSLVALVKQAGQLNSGGFVNMLKMAPQAGYQDSGTDLYVESVDFVDSSKNQTIGPNLAVPPPILLTNRFYEISAHSTYRIEPFVSMSAVPLLSNVPGLGAPVVLTAIVKRTAEFPQGLVRGPGGQTGTATNNAPTGALTSFASPISSGHSAEPWTRPGIYNEIEASGQQIIDHAVVLVLAKNAIWTETGLVVKPGQTVWLDFRADGAWGKKGQANLTADGEIDNTNYTTGIYQAYGLNLVGAIDPKDPVIKVQSAGSIHAPDSKVPYDFTVGTALYKYQPTKTGPLKLGFNNLNASFEADLHASSGFSQKSIDEQIKDYYAQNHEGEMTVRIIVTQ